MWIELPSHSSFAVALCLFYCAVWMKAQLLVRSEVPYHLTNAWLFVFAALPVLPAELLAGIWALTKPLPKLSFSCWECYIRAYFFFMLFCAKPFILLFYSRNKRDLFGSRGESKEHILSGNGTLPLIGYLPWTLCTPVLATEESKMSDPRRS